MNLNHINFLKDNTFNIINFFHLQYIYLRKINIRIISINPCTYQCTFFSYLSFYQNGFRATFIFNENDKLLNACLLFNGMGTIIFEYVLVCFK